MTAEEHRQAWLIIAGCLPLLCTVFAVTAFWKRIWNLRAELVSWACMAVVAAVAAVVVGMIPVIPSSTGNSFVITCYLIFAAMMFAYMQCKAMKFPQFQQGDTRWSLVVVTGVFVLTRLFTRGTH